MNLKSLELRFEYNALLALLSLPLIALVLFQALRRGGVRFALQRLGFGYGRMLPKPVWVHAASVGEVMAVLPLIEQLRARAPHTPLVVSTTTPTGAHVAASKLPSDVTHVYLPVDFAGAVRRFIRVLDPRVALIVETELWPNLFQRCRRARVPLLIVNARLSRRTLGANRWIRRHYRAALDAVTAVLARSEHDRDGFIELGAAAKNAEVIGNLKFAQPMPDARADRPLPMPYVLAASTHADEEVRLVRAWLGLNVRRPLLVLAPRHPQRMREIVKDLERFKVNFAVRSLGDEVTAQTQVYVADTVGELQWFIAHAELVYMGGSLVDVGGHNVLEPARAGKAQVYGTHMRNFAEEARLLQERGAAIQVRDDLELRTTLARLLAAPQRCIAMGERARDLVNQHHGVAALYADAIARHIPLKTL
jgi:3-deoxy-D-manno-octulosonic-acid transferase